MERDPVCGMSVNPETAKARAEHDGKAYYFCCGGCAQKFQQDPAKYLAAPAPSKKAAISTPAAIVAKAALAVLPVLGETPKEKDPVCGMVVDPKKPAGKIEHAGKTYYFCSTRCAGAFCEGAGEISGRARNGGHGAAAKRARHTSAQNPQTSATPARWIPQIVQIGPGTCPICGMALEPMDIVADDQPDPEYESMRKRFWVSAALVAASADLVDVWRGSGPALAKRNAKCD